MFDSPDEFWHPVHMEQLIHRFDRAVARYFPPIERVASFFEKALEATLRDWLFLRRLKKPYFFIVLFLLFESFVVITYRTIRHGTFYFDCCNDAEAGIALLSKLSL